jgi:hypothetical protein
MLRLRNIDGSVRELDDGERFIEICSVDGKIAAVFYQDDAGVIHQLSAKDAEARRYSELFKAPFCNTISIQR